MQSVLQVDGHLFPGNRQLKVWRPRHPQIGRRIRVVVEHLHAFQDRNVPITVALYGDTENARGTEDAVGNVPKRERD